MLGNIIKGNAGNAAPKDTIKTTPPKTNEEVKQQVKQEVKEKAANTIKDLFKKKEKQQ